ncbi:MAG: hypothetical protein ACJAZF_004986 [Granulosicoccus sp.]|jgi:hypothetical protein
MKNLELQRFVLTHYVGTMWRFEKRNNEFNWLEHAFNGTSHSNRLHLISH